MDLIMWRAVARRGVVLGETTTATATKPYARCASSSSARAVVTRRGVVRTAATGTESSSSLSNQDEGRTTDDDSMRRAAPRAVADWAEPEIRRFRRLDEEETRGAACVVFTGSSIFREWRERRDFDADWNRDGGLSALKAVNRGFGGSMTVDVLRHAASVVNHEARDVKAVVYYAGSNDLSVGVSPKTCAENFVAFVENCRARAAKKDGSKVGVVYVGVIDSPQKRAFGLSPAVRETNALCRKWCEETPDSAFVDVEATFSNPDGSVREEMFREDGTHLVAEAYVAFKAAIEPKLDEVLKGALGKSAPDDEDFLPPSMRSMA